jgi:hypothetical protein
VERVSTGFQGLREIDTVIFDPGRITVQQMVDVLTRAGTYRGTAQ